MGESLPFKAVVTGPQSLSHALSLLRQFPESDAVEGHFPLTLTERRGFGFVGICLFWQSLEADIFAGKWEEVVPGTKKSGLEGFSAMKCTPALIGFGDSQAPQTLKNAHQNLPLKAL